MNAYEKRETFQRIFKRPMMIDALMTGLTGKLQLDFVKMDTWLHDYVGYTEEEHGSMEDFIKLEYGEQAALFIRQEFLTNDQEKDRSK